MLKMEAAQVAHRWRNGSARVVPPYGGILSSPKEEANSDPWKKLEDIMLNEISSRTKQDKYGLIALTRDS